MMVLDDKTCPVGMVLNLERFFARESCGWCTPCRDGLPWAARLLQAIEEGEGRPGDLEMLDVPREVHGTGPDVLRPGARAPPSRWPAR